MLTLTSLGNGLVFIDTCKYNNIIDMITNKQELSYEQFNSIEFKCVDDAMYLETGNHFDVALIAHAPMPIT